MTNDCLKDIKNIVIEHPKTEDGKTKKSSDQSISECIQKSADDFMDQIDTSEKTEEQKESYTPGIHHEHSNDHVG